MSPKKHPILPILTTALLFIILGYLRDFLFINWNMMLGHLWNPEQVPFKGHSFFDFLKQFNYNTLYYTKFFLTGLFTLFNLFLGWLLLFWLFHKRKYLLWSLYIYILVGAISLLFYASGYWLNDPHGGYKFARLFMGFLQSPVPFMILVPGVLLREASREKGKAKSDGSF